MAKKTGRQKSPKSAPPRKTPWLWGIVAVLAVVALYPGYRGVGHGPRNAAKAPSLPPIVQNPSKTGFTWKYRAYAIKTKKPAYLVKGSKMTVVMLMASWCLYCAYDDKYVWPSLLHEKGLTLDIVDVSNHGGIGDPGPESPPFSGHDNYQSATIGARGMIQTMNQYVKQFSLNYPNVHVYVDPNGLSYWSVKNFPTILLINGKGQLVDRVDGALTKSSAQKLVAQVMSGKSRG